MIDIKHKITINGIKSNEAWKRYCASFAKPCAHNLKEVEEYIKAKYDVNPIDYEIDNLQIKQLSDHVHSFHSSNNYQAELNKIPMTASAEEFYITHHKKLTSHINNQYKDSSIKHIIPHGYKILPTEKNRILIKNMLKYDISLFQSMYINYDVGYILWDELTEVFYTYGYGSLELHDDMRLYHGINQEDIDNLTYRFTMFINYLYIDKEHLTGDKFYKNMDMCAKYGYKNIELIFMEMFNDCNIIYKAIDTECINWYRHKWYHTFVPIELHDLANRHHYFDHDGLGGYMWHVFSYEDVDCVVADEAIKAYDMQDRDECILFFNEGDIGYEIKRASGLSSNEINAYSEIYVIDKDFTWTYIHTHESECGPYFYNLK